MGVQKNINDIFKIIEEIAIETSGVVTTKQIEQAGIYRGMIRRFVDEGKLIKEAKGLYSLTSEYSDEYFILQKRSEKMVFSYGTALYLWGMSDRVPHIIDVSVPQGFNGSRIKKDNEKLRFHYIQVDKWDIGITEIQTTFGNTIILYDKERCICDLVVGKKQVDKQLYVQAIKEYFAGEYNVRKIIKYGKIFGIEEELRNYMDIML